MKSPLDVSQEAAVSYIIKSGGISVLTGGPGFGKTFTIQELLRRLWSDYGIRPDLTRMACPTGKAAKVLEDALDIEVENRPSTIHRMLGCQGQIWEYGPTNRLSTQCLILDEASMIDSKLLARVITSISEGCKIILVGDKDQLPPVAAGCPFRDILTYGKQEAVSRLQTNHRQAQGSLIADACGRVIDGSKPLFGKQGEKTLGGKRQDDLFFIEEEDKEEIPNTVAAIARSWHDTGKDYCVLAPQRTGVCGVEAMNKYLQETLNPPSKDKYEISVAPWLTLREGDKVLHTKNNYGLDVFNGFTGRILDIDPVSQVILVDFDGQYVSYTETKDIKQLTLGYCLTVHKSQGSQYKYGVLVCHSSHYYMWSRQLLYTALSRFREELYVVGNNKAIKRAITNSQDDSRNTYLKLALNSTGRAA